MTMAVDSKGRGKIDKDPDAVLDYLYNWADWLTDISDYISSHTFQDVTGVVIDSSAIVDADTSADIPVTVISGGVRAMISGGTPGEPASATCRIVTNGGRTEDRTIIFKIRER